MLEQAGIAYPILDPLRALVGESAMFALQCFPRHTMARELQRESRIHSAHSPNSDFEPARPANPEPHQLPPDQLPLTSDFPQLPSYMVHRGGGRPGIWHNLYGSFVDHDDDTSMGSWPSQRYASNMSGLQGFYDPSFLPCTYGMGPSWPQHAALSGQCASSNSNGIRSRRDKNAQQIMMALRDDQSRQSLEAVSPSKKQRVPPNGLPAQRITQAVRPPIAQAHRPPKMGALSVPVRPSSAVVDRTTSYPDFNTALRTNSKRPSSNQANFNATAASKSTLQTTHQTNKKEDCDTSQSRMLVSHPFMTRVPTPNPFMLGPQRRDSDVSMRDGFSNFSSFSRFERDPAQPRNKAGSAHAPSTGGNVKSRKEGLATDDCDLFDMNIRHDQNLLPVLSANPSTKAKSTADDTDRTPGNRAAETLARLPSHAEVIDVDAIDPSLVTEKTADLAKLSPSKPSHKSGMSSISSTGRLERQLYSALGEELGSFEQQMNTTGMGHELGQALSGNGTHGDLSDNIMLDPAVGEFEPVVKRKRQGTLGGERDKSPMKKKERARQAIVENNDTPEDMPRVRGD